MSLTESKLLSFIKEQTNFEDVTITTPLFSTGNLDSVTQLNLIIFVETESGIQIQQSDITLENFDTAKNILNFVTGVRLRSK